jgi:hypothetical protein
MEMTEVSYICFNNIILNEFKWKWTNGSKGIRKKFEHKTLSTPKCDMNPILKTLK